MGLVREFEEKAARTGRQSLVKDAQRYAEELGMKLDTQNTQNQLATPKKMRC